MSLTLEVGDENITITDKGDNVMTFPLVSENPTEDAPETAKVLIQKIQDAIGNEVTVTALADSPLKIASVTDGANRVTTLHYTDVGATGFRHRGRMKTAACASTIIMKKRCTLRTKMVA